MFSLTFNPKFFNPALHHCGLEADSEGCQQKESDKENLSSVALEKMAQLEELRLQFGT